MILDQKQNKKIHSEITSSISLLCKILRLSCQKSLTAESMTYRWPSYKWRFLITCAFINIRFEQRQQKKPMLIHTEHQIYVTNLRCFRVIWHYTNKHLKTFKNAMTWETQETFFNCEEDILIFHTLITSHVSLMNCNHQIQMQKTHEGNLRN